MCVIMHAYQNQKQNQKHPVAQLELEDDMNIFILAGQSNMAGKGGVVNETWDGVVPPECGPHPRILRLSAELRWVEAREPLHVDISVKETVGVGPGLAFANTVLSSIGGVVVGLVPCAVCGTGIEEWARGSDLYNQMVRRARAALQGNGGGGGGGGGGGALRAVLWYQGESDTESIVDAELYEGRLEKFFMDLRTDLQSPELLIIQVAIASGIGAYVEKVREAQLGIDMAKVICVDAKGLELEPDHLHLNTPAQVQLGEMLADAFLQTQPYAQPTKQDFVWY